MVGNCNIFAENSYILKFVDSSMNCTLKYQCCAAQYCSVVFTSSCEWVYVCAVRGIIVAISVYIVKASVRTNKMPLAQQPDPWSKLQVGGDVEVLSYLMHYQLR